VRRAQTRAPRLHPQRSDSRFILVPLRPEAAPDDDNGGPWPSNRS
jgi:hypothetical protein